MRAKVELLVYNFHKCHMLKPNIHSFFMEDVTCADAQTNKIALYQSITLPVNNFQLVMQIKSLDQ